MLARADNNAAVIVLVINIVDGVASFYWHVDSLVGESFSSAQLLVFGWASICVHMHTHG
jgi:hypothetical protein